MNEIESVTEQQRAMRQLGRLHGATPEGERPFESKLKPETEEDKLHYEAGLAEGKAVAAARPSKEDIDAKLKAVGIDEEIARFAVDLILTIEVLGEFGTPVALTSESAKASSDLFDPNNQFVLVAKKIVEMKRFLAAG